MHDVVFVEHLKGVDELFEYEQRLSFLDDPFFAEHAL